MRSITVSFPGSDGHKLTGTIDLPEQGEPTAFAIFAHCFTCNRLSPAAARISRGLAADGIAVLRFDFPGLGDSEGEFHEATFSSNAADLVCAYEYMVEHHAAPQLIVGHSLGGAAVLAAAGSMESIKAVVTIGSPFDPAHVVHMFADSIESADNHGQAETQLAGRDFTISRKFLEDLAEQEPTTRIARLKKPLLVLHSPTDQTVGLDSAEKIFQTARHPKSFISLDGVDHLLTKRGAGERVAKIIRAWVDNYLQADINTDSIRRPLPAGVVRVEENGVGVFSQSIRAGKHVWMADQSRAQGGGRGLGPSAEEYFLGAIGSSTAATIRLYAQHKRIAELTRVSVEVRKDEKVFDGQRKVVIYREVQLDGDLSADLRATLLEVAEKAPLQVTLEADMVMHTTEVC